MQKKDNTTFQNLAKEMSPDERKIMLHKVKNGQIVPSQTEEEVVLEGEKKLAKEEDLATRLKRESLFKRLIYRIIATFKNMSVEDVFNQSLVNKIAKDIEHNYPALIDSRHKLLENLFYEKLLQIKTSAEFFAPYIEKYEAASGAFYAQIAHIIVPGAETEIEAVSDPYQNPLSKEPNAEVKASLVHKMDDALENLESVERSQIYANVRAVEWLRQFVRLPFSKLVSRFSASEGGERDCLYTQIKAEFAEFTRIFNNYITITDPVLEALYTFNIQKRREGMQDIDETHLGFVNFTNEASARLADIQIFSETIPIYSLSKIVFENALYVPPVYSGGEDWFAKYKSYWHGRFEYRYAKWLRDVKKEHLKKGLNDYFHLSNFPLFPFRPWEHVWSVPQFQYELTLGFINSFFKNEFPKYNKVLKIAGVEGVFSIKENQIEFTDSLGLLQNVNENLDLLATQLSAGGEYGLEFAKYEEEPERHPEASAARIDEMLDEIEKFTRNNIIGLFGKACRNMKNLLSGMLGEKVTAYYAQLSNLMRIQGHANKEFRLNLLRVKNGIDHAYTLLQELEPLDMPIE